jgi:flagellar protein FliS
MLYGLAQARYASDAAQTVSPARLLTMLYDRLVLDLSLAEVAIQEQDYEATGERIGRAMEILLELRGTLDLATWPEGEPLARLYLWMLGELSQARIRQLPQRVADVRALVEPLRAAWHEAARDQVRPSPATAAPEAMIGGAA